MRLFHGPTSPFVRMVMVVLHETGQVQDVELVPTSGTPLDPAAHLLPQNPLGKVPALERPDGCTLYDSRVICRYLDRRGAGGLYPGGAREWEALTLEATAHGILDAALQMVYETRLRPDTHAMPRMIEAHWGKIARALDALEARWMSHLTGPPDIGQIALGCALDYLDLRHDARDWRRGHAGLAGWAARFAQRPAMAATATAPASPA